MFHCGIIEVQPRSVVGFKAFWVQSNVAFLSTIYCDALALLILACSLFGCDYPMAKVVISCLIALARLRALI